ncbi:flavin monoamine oxidase family protein [Amycolatopsis sp. NPDC059027]|uniref:flavin monoamine oxidase family protein n=1 Tax=Amycolatopsis sp. NPDC059027 TaxID=3346709 RepID=UPI00366FE6BD
MEIRGRRERSSAVTCRLDSAQGVTEMSNIISERDRFSTSTTKKVTIIGAGVAGLVAACELEDLGHHVEILEGSGRVGGRVRTHRFRAGPAAPLVELGAMRVPAKHRLAMAYITKLGLTDKVRDFSTLFSEDETYYTTGDGYVRVGDAATTLVDEFRHSLAEHRYRDHTILFGAWLMAVGTAIAPRDFRGGLREEFSLELLDQVDRIDLSPFLRGRAKNQVDLSAFFAAHPEVRPGRNGELNRFVDDILCEISPELVRLEGGMDQFTRRLAERIQGPVSLGQEVVGLHVRDDDVLIDIREGDRLDTRRCDYVLCTIPFPVLRRFALSGFSASKLAAIHEMKYWSATKVAFRCREAFWERHGITGGASFGGGRIRQTYYPPVEGDPANGAALLASYTIGDDADVLGRMPAAVRHAAVLTELGRMHPELLRPDMVVDAASLAWGQHRWSEGAAAVRWGKDADECERERVRAARPEHRLFFAGEHCSSTTAWIEGAIESAINAVGEIHFHRPRARLMPVGGAAGKGDYR